MDTVLASGVAVLLVVLGTWCVVARDASTAIVVFVAYGLLLAIAWIGLWSVDVALTEAAIGSGLTGALLLGAAARLRADDHAAEHAGMGLRALAALLSAAIASGLGAAAVLLPDAAPTLAPAAAENAGATGLGNPVTNVLMAFRALDTMLEKVVLLLALVGVWSLAPDAAWGGAPVVYHPRDREQRMLVFLARLLPPIGIVAGIHVLWAGADHPGGAFQGGTILAAMGLLVAMAGLARLPPVSHRLLRTLLVAGPAVFLIVGLGGLWLGSAFLAYPPGAAKPLILAIELAMTLTIAVTLALLLAGPPARVERSR